jgi:hypothetical protein
MLYRNHTITCYVIDNSNNCGDSMAPKIVITEQARYEEVRLGIDLSEMTESVIKYIPPSDLVGIVMIVFADRTDRKAMASYFRKQGTQEA